MEMLYAIAKRIRSIIINLILNKMKHFLAILILTLFTINTFSQITDTGDEIGIGTTSPLGKVDILAETDEVALRLSMPTSEDAAAYDIKWANSNADVVHRIQYSNTYYDFMNVNRATREVSFIGGNFGIGTTNPNTKLDILTNHSSQIPIRITHNNYNDWVLQKRRTDNTQLFGIKEENSNGSMGLATSGITRMTIDNQGKVGIGILIPESKLHILQSSEDYSSGIKIVGSTSPISGRIWMGTEKLHIDNATAGTGSGLTLLKDGSIGIGTVLSSNPNNYKLAVNGTLGAKEVKVEISSLTWSDFVFSDNYKLKSIKEVENYINEKNHLPDIPTANEVEKNGVNLGEMDAKLLQKIEELTLYVIDLQKQVDDLKSQLNEQQ